MSGGNFVYVRLQLRVVLLLNFISFHFTMISAILNIFQKGFLIF